MTPESYISDLLDDIKEAQEKLDELKESLKWAQENPQELADYVAEWNADRREFLLKHKEILQEIVRSEKHYNDGAIEHNQKYPNSPLSLIDQEGAIGRLKDVEEELATLPK